VQLDEDVEVRPKGEDDAYTILLDPSRVQQDFGWSPKVPLEEGVRRAIEYYREYGVSQTYTHLKVGE
jgi:UDP-glucose 4-epimerase